MKWTYSYRRWRAAESPTSLASITVSYFFLEGRKTSAQYFALSRERDWEPVSCSSSLRVSCGDLEKSKVLAVASRSPPAARAKPPTTAASQSQPRKPPPFRTTVSAGTAGRAFPGSGQGGAAVPSPARPCRPLRALANHGPLRQRSRRSRTRSDALRCKTLHNQGRERHDDAQLG